MAAFTKATLIITLVLLNTPHLLCPLVCAAKTSHVTNAPKCPHCAAKKSTEPNNPLPPTPTDNCRSGCCNQDPGVVVPITQVTTELPSTLFTLPSAAVSSTYVSVILPTCRRVDYWPPPPSLRPGSQLSILLERFLL